MPSFPRRTKQNLVILIILILLVVYIFKIQNVYQTSKPINFIGFNNVTGDKNLIVPNIIHYIQFDQRILSFLPFICICSAFYNQSPSRIYIHTNNALQGKYFEYLRRVLGERLVVRTLEKPSHVFGQKLSSVEHSADVARLKILMKYGGIFLDEDVFVVRNLNKFRHFELAIGWPEKQNIGSQVIVAHKDARFLPLYLDQYRNYRANYWYYNAGEAPTSNILSTRPELVHRVKLQFGVENLSSELYSQTWAGWEERHSIHLLSRHQNYLTNTSTANLSEQNYHLCHCTLAIMIQSVITNLHEDGLNIVTELDTLEEDVENFLKSSSKSLLHQNLNRKLYSTLMNKRTPVYKTQIRDVIRSGLVHLDSNIGVYAPDVESYSVFDKLFRPIIKKYHRIPGRLHHPSSNWNDQMKRIGSFASDQVISTRIRIARSLQGFPLNSKMSEEDYIRLEKTVRPVLESLTGDLSGVYLSVSGMTKSEQSKLVSEHLMFDVCDSYLQDAGACQHWPAGRGIFLNEARTFVVWVGEEDHLRIISIQSGGGLAEVFARLGEAVETLSRRLQFVRDDSLGFITFCPSNLGTTLRASVHVRLPHLASQGRLEGLAAEKSLQVRGTGGEHTQTVGGVVDLSNTRRLGATELDIVAEMFEAVSQIIQEEKSITGNL